MSKTHHDIVIELAFDSELPTDKYELLFHYTFYPGHPGRGADMSGPGDPPEAPELEIVDTLYRKAGLEETTIWSPMPGELAAFLGVDELLENDDFFLRLCENAEEARGENSS